ncbi:hypothetical protein QBC34DRAFT_412399 [Podospora aff. communis PSN243]|uniref:Uncharacterized protein n=1 Tax=Podospora aff. communis PSN243 TaxID=3040156 RepID=A0AAV9GFV9_9PEZI|nr:hypothetical protein QBC34DRAFT_412399 [Podospora aff. communis PSN243]
MSNGAAKGNIPDLLFHTILTVIDYHVDTSGSTRNVYVLGTHTTLEAAKAFSLKALSSLGYEPDDFAEYASRADTPAEKWTHGDGVFVYAKAPAGQAFTVSLDTTPNNESLPEGENQTLEFPKGFNHLHYVLQTKIDYNQDKSGAYQTTEIEGCYVRRADALSAAKVALAEMDKQGFSQYDERDSEDEKGQWPFGEDVIVHAVAETGENYTVCVRTAPGAHKRFSKKQKQ